MTSHIPDPDLQSSRNTDDAALPRVSQKRLWRVWVSLESERNPVLTYRGEVTASSPIGAASRGIQAARKAFPGKKANSWTLTLEKI